jgi:hypothetical protein
VAKNTTVFDPGLMAGRMGNVDVVKPPNVAPVWATVVVAPPLPVKTPEPPAVSVAPKAAVPAAFTLGTVGRPANGPPAPPPATAMRVKL